MVKFAVEFWWKMLLTIFPAKEAQKSPSKLRRNWPRGSTGVQRCTGVSRGVRRTTWERSLKNWELQIPCFEEFLGGENVLGLVPASLPHTLGYACTFYAPTSPPPTEVRHQFRRKLRQLHSGYRWCLHLRRVLRGLCGSAGRVPGGRTAIPEGPRIEKNQSREAIWKKSSFQYGMKFSIENEFFIPGPSLAAEKQGLGLKFSIENEIFKLRMKISSENENFKRGGMFFFFFSCVRARMNFFDPRALWDYYKIIPWSIYFWN